MRHGNKVNHLGRKTAHRKAMLQNMACSLIEHKRIQTTLAKAKELRVFVEPILTKSKDDTMHNRRTAFAYLQNKYAVKELFGNIRPAIAERPGGYLRILKTGNRLGDNAEMCLIELVDFNTFNSGKATTTTGKKRRRQKKSAENATTVVETVTPVVAETVSSEEKATLDFSNMGTASKEGQDNLEHIKGVAEGYANRLNNVGIYTYEQISKMNDADIEQVAEAIGVSATRIKREKWVYQSSVMHQRKLNGENVDSEFEFPEGEKWIDDEA